MILHKAGYTIRVSSWENDADNRRTVDFYIGEKEKVEVVVKFANLFRSKNSRPAGIGNLFDNCEAYGTLTEFYEENMPWFCEDIDLEGIVDEDEEAEIIGDCMLEFAYELGLSGSEYFATRVLEKLQVLYFENYVVCVDRTEEFQTS